ncbi:hypothetical protein CSB11_02110 [Candidatus Campbellbacteria bacterium]|nr:MAG: hypothetical protein CSB11_02110 [Candidatus Campbellbacteria bacterium]
MKIENVSKITEKILENLPERSKEVLEKRFGLIEGKPRQTLDSIGQSYGITRERIRQIENSAKKLILETEKLTSHTQQAVDELKKTIDSYGGIIGEKELLEKFTTNQDVQDHIHFILNLSEPFFEVKKQEYKDKVWYTQKESFEAFEKSLKKLYQDLSTDEVLTEKEILDRFSEKLSHYTDNKKILKIDTVKRLIGLSKKIGSNELGQWGDTKSRNISTKGVKDCAYLILNEEGHPMHFTEITNEIAERFHRNVNTATVHNELIKDKRFILIGRGKYGLTEWNKYSGGTVAEVIADILKKSKKALTKEEIVKKVLEKKEVRKQTILINLSNKKFKKTKDGRYTLNKITTKK